MREGKVKEKEDVEGTNERGESTGEGMKKCRKEGIPVSVAKPWKMFISHNINIVSANYLESVT